MGKCIARWGEMNISGNALDLLLRCTETSSDVFRYSSYIRPSMVFEDILLSGK
ncbi:MAG: hypothetical protein HC896_12890 [Bacteroidales bacterium]|nr:hypothetical protein [Bacteroidales bacterium]